MQSVKWGEYKIGELFDIKSYRKRFDANKVNVKANGKYPYIVRMSSNNGQKGFINEDPQYLNDGNTISFGQDTATMYYQERSYFTGDKIKIFKPKQTRFGKSNAQFFLASMRQSFAGFTWGSSSFNVEVLKRQKIQLPTKANQIDFDFMESFIAELEAQRIAKLESYLSASGLKDYTLTTEEKTALENFGNLQWGEFTFKSIFNKIKQGRRLKTDDQISGTIPFVMSGITNAGVVNYISNPVASFPKNSITIDIFGNTFYRDYAFGAGDDTGVYWNDEKVYSKEEMLFFAATMAKTLSGKFSFGKKLRSSQSLDLKMSLPIKEGQIDFEYITKFISAIQKLIIKDVVLYADEK